MISTNASGDRGLFGGFEGQRVARETELDQAIAQALVSIDANVLLSLYRYADEFSTELLRVFENLGDRIFVSDQALVEFWRNRTSALEDRARAKSEVERRLHSEERSVIDALETWGKHVAIDDRDAEQARELVIRQFEVLRRVVSDNHRDDVQNYPSPGMDPIVQTLDELLAGRVGPRLCEDDWGVAVAEGNSRHASERPPGYKEKVAEKQHLPEGVAGDYLVWLQSMIEAERRGLDLLLVTGDEKEDWYWRSRDTVIGPRPELAKEFWDRTGRRLLMLTPLGLLRRCQAQGSDALKGVLDAEAEREGRSASSAPSHPEGASETPGSWSLEAVRRLLEMLDVDAPVQANVIRAAAKNGGSIERADVYDIGGYDPKRMLRGFTRPVRRVSRQLQEMGHLDLNAPDMLQPRYDKGVQAKAFDVPPEVVALLSANPEETWR